MKRRPPIPPLADSAIDRIERGVFAALDARAVQQPAVTRGSRRRLLAFAMAGAAAMAGVFGVREWRRGDGPTAHAHAEITTTDSGSHIALAGAVLDVAPHSAITFGDAHDGATVVILARGTVTCEVTPRSKRAPFVVEAGATRVTVIGTKFTVHREGEHASVSVEHGLVEVADTNMTELVHAGERYRPGESVTREPVALVATPAPVASATAPAAGSATIPVPAAAASAVSAAPLHALARQTRRRRLASAEPAPDESAAPNDGAGAEASAAVEAAPAAEAPAAAAEEAPAAAAEDKASSGPRRASVQVLFELAAQLEVRDPAAALRIYGELSTGGDGWAASALFAAARLEAERGHATQARTLCDAYLQRFPGGPNADDARTLLATLH